MQSREIRQKYIEFFVEHGHVELPSASLIPENDSTTLFNTAGMQPLIPFLLGEDHPANNAIVNCQKCVRTGDIECVGDNSHLTFFEMLGNWPLGKYGKQEAIKYSFEFLTSKKWLGIDPNKLYVTVFEGDKDIEKDIEAIKIWQECFDSIGIKANENEKIFALPKDDNFWGPVGSSGPCGPDSEMFVDTGYDKCSDNCKPGCHCGKYIEIWNDVFMFYYKNLDGTYKKLDKPQIDTGFGLERATTVLNNLDNVYDTDLFIPIVDEIKNLANISNPNDEQLKSIRIISDHIRSAVFVMGDDLGIAPSNVNQGYVVRRLIRNAIRHGKLLNIKDVFCFKIAEVVINLMSNIYPELKNNKDFIINQIVKEEEQFKKTLDNGLKEFNKLEKITGADAFKLYSTYGFPLEMTTDLIKEKGLNFDINEFNSEFKKHKELSRTASEGMFKGGLADHSEIVTKYHTATHLLHQALRETLGTHVEQRGSNLTAERMRFDFSHPNKLTPDQLQMIEDLVNQKINESLSIICELKPIEEAKNSGAIGLFGNKYGDQVNVYAIGNFSKEICGGPHVQNTNELGHFRIIKEEACSQGVRRIKAVLE
ncbi:MAG: alanine--tRNA ligase [Patescibacteria group bacterium]|nr:alanine--tRNA ligase [Patescibacteria group bacterium]MDD4304339.1 alanine--tRNA ligase [Patescibacteria group bacterium]MDD4695602.1 alanine--tRNA ligase [Patescibacteria group bacterium]